MPSEKKANLLYASPLTADLFRLTLDDLYRWQAEDFFAFPEQREQLLKELRLKGRLEDFELVLRRGDGTQFPASITSKRIVYGDQEAFFSTLIDLTESKAAQELRLAKEQADTANRAKSQFLAHMSHELRTPLNAILGYAQILRRDHDLNEKQRDSLEVIHTSGEHLLGLINGILDLAKIESSKLEVNPVIFDLQYFLRSIDRIFSAKAAEKQLYFNLQASAQLPATVQGDEQKLRQIIFNLIGNALKFTDRGGVTLTVTQQPDAQIQFEVSDTGRGIHPQDLELIFQPFQQVGALSKMIEGTGLGLTISRSMVELLGGELHVDSSVGKGSRFWFTLVLPAVDSTAPSMVSKPPVIGYTGRRQCILVVDDNADNRAVLVDMLTPVDFVILEAENGAEALAQASTSRPDAILMDLRMPVMDGLEAMRQIRNTPELREMIVIGISASAFGHDREQCLAAGADEFLPKPFRQEDLFGLLGKALNLQLIYQDSVTAQPVSAVTQHTLPPAEQLHRLQELARQGDIGGIFDEAKQLQLQDSRYESFAEELQTLAKQFKIRKITALLNAGDASLSQDHQE